MTNKEEKQRTNRQNRALHLMFTHLADDLNSAGFDQRKVLKPGVQIPWSSESIKERLWRPVQEAQLNKKSTTELTTKEIDQVFDTLCRHLGNQFGIQLEFPCIDHLMQNMESKNHLTK